MNLRQQAIQGVAWTAVQNWGSNLITTVVFLVLAGLLGVDAVGLVTYAAAFTAVMAIFQRQGIGQAVVQRPDLEPGHVNTAFCTSALAGVVLTALLALAAGPIAAFVDKPDLGPVLRVLAFTLVIEALAVTPRAILRRRMAFKSLAFRALIASTAGGIVGVWLALAGYGVWALVWHRLVSSAAGTLTLWVASGWRPGLAMSRRHFREVFGFGVFIMGNETLQVINQQTAPLLIGTFLGDEPLGYYRVGYQMLMMMTRLFIGTVAAVTLPTFSRIQQHRAQLRSAYLTAARMTSILIFPVSIGAALLAPEFIRGTVGERWVPAIPVMRVLSLLGAAQAVSFFNMPTIIACGKVRTAFRLALGNTLTNVFVFLVTVPWGIVAVAAGYTLRGYLYPWIPWRTVAGLVDLRLRGYLVQFGPSLGATAVMAAAVVVIKMVLGGVMPPLALLIVGTVAGAGVYALALHLIEPARLKEVLANLRLARPGAASP